MRSEHVIAGRNAQLTYFCGYCEHEWTVAEVAQKAATPARLPLRKPRTHTFGPTRKRN